MAESPEPPIEVLVSDSDAPVGEAVTGRGLSPAWLVLVGVALAAVAFLVVTSDDDRSDVGDRDDDRTPSTTSRGSGPSTTVAAAVSNTVSVAPGRSGPLLGRRFDASLLLGGPDEGWWLVDLDAGSARPVPMLDGVPAQALTPVRGGVAMVDLTPAAPVVVPLIPGDAVGAGPGPRPLDTGVDGADLTGPTVGVLAGDGPDEVWVLHGYARSSSPGLLATLVEVDGEVLAGPIDVPGTPVAATARSIVFNAAGRTFLASADGIDDVGPGTAYDAGGGSVVRVVCDEAARCAVETYDVDSGSRHAGPVVETNVASDERVTIVQSAQGGVVAVPGFRQGLAPGFTPAATLRVALANETPAAIDVPSIRAAPAWLPDGQSLLVLTNIGLLHVSLEDGLLAGRRIEGVDVGDSTNVFVIPGDDAEVPAA